MAKILNVTISPTFEFYSKLLYLLHGSSCFSYTIARNLLKIKAENPEQISLRIELGILEQWFEKSIKGGRKERRLLKFLASSCFSDFSKEKLDGDTRNLLGQWANVADFSRELIDQYLQEKGA